MAETLVWPELAILSPVSARRLDRWSKHAPATVASYLGDEKNDSVSLDNGRAGELTASAEIETGTRINVGSPPATRFMAYLALPLDMNGLEGVLDATLALAAKLSVSTGFVTVEPTYGLAHRTAVGHSIVKERSGLSLHRMRERHVRDYKNELTDTQLSGVEWGTFLGAGHLDRVDWALVRKANVFERIVEVTPSLYFLQLTADPVDDLSPEIEERYRRAREALASVLLDTTDPPAPRPDAL